ncbi:MAG: NADH-quinone oxidoreductase subunit N [Acidimicrobiia bacterium]
MGYDIDYLALAPEITLAVTAMVVLSLDLVLTRQHKYWTAIAAVLGVGFSAFPLITLAVSDTEVRSMFDGSYVVDDFALVLKALFIAAGYLVLLMSVQYIESDRYYQGEYYFLVLMSILGSVVMASARDLIILFIGLELVSGPLFLLAGWRKGDARSNEASLKYFLLGVLSAAILLYGMSLLYGTTGSITFDGIREASVGLTDEPIFVLAVLFVVIGFAFKVSAVPFHFWAPDTYEGAPTPITAYLSVSSKAAGFVGLLMITYQALPEASHIWGPALWIMAVLSMTVANLTALRQNNIVRLLAYSSVAQAGFMLVPFAVAGVSSEPDALSTAFSATITYLIIYAFMNLGAFAIVIAGARRTQTGDIDGWAGFGRYAPGLGILAAIFFFSLAGIPPLAGWYAKFVMFNAALGGGSWWTGVLAAIAAVNAVIAFYYYARIIKTIWMDEAPEPIGGDDQPVVGSLRLALILSAAVVVIAGFFPDVINFFSETTRLLALG